MFFVFSVDKVDCYETSSSAWYIDVNNYCWNNFTDVIRTPAVSLPHKMFPIITLCEAMSMILPLLIWYWCFGKSLKNQITAVIDRSNTLTEYYRMYDRGMHRSVSESTLHRELDNLLELLLHLFINKMTKIYVLYTVKWVLIIIICSVWVVGQVFLLYPDLIIFQDSFHCVLKDTKGATISASCAIPTSTFLRAVWYINIAFLSLLIICTFACLIMIGRKVRYTSTFFYTSVPGVMDSRLSDCIQETFNSRHISLLSRFCEDNTNLCTNPGLSRSLSRKYGVPDGSTPGRETIMDKHFPVLQPEQLKRFRICCELFRTKNDKENKRGKRAKVRFARERDDLDTKSINSATDSVISKISVNSRYNQTVKKNKVHHLDRDFYMTPRLMARKMGKDLKSIKNSPRLSSLNSSQRTPRSISSLDIGHLSQRSSTPRHSEVSSRRQDNKYMDVHAQTTGHYPVFASRNRELNPYAYRLHTLIMKTNARNSSTWKP